MNNTRKKILCVAMALIMFALCICLYTTATFNSASAMETVETTSAVSELEKPSSERLSLYEKVLNQFSEEKQTDNMSVTYSDDFGGAYVDDYGMLNIGIVANPRTKSIKSISNFDGQVTYKSYTYSYNYLSEIKSAICPFMIEYTIYKTAIYDSINKVVVYLNNEAFIDKIISFLKKENLYDENAIDFIVEPLTSIVTTSTTVYSGDEIAYKISDEQYELGTIGATVKCNKTGEYGIITNGHVAPENKSMIYNWQPLGKRSRGQSSGTIDAAFVPFSNQNSWQTSPNSRHGSETFTNIFLGAETHIVEGQAVKRIGYSTGITTGKITSRNVSFSITVDGSKRVIDNSFEYDNAPLSGDSGGPVYFDDGDGNLYLIGLNTAGTSKSGYACRTSEVMRILDVSPITNDPLPLGMEVVRRHGVIIYDWDIKLINRNDFPVSVVYNARMCYENDARFFRNLAVEDERYIEIPANKDVEVRINGNGNAGWITAAIITSSVSKGYGMIVSYTSGLGLFGLNTPSVNPIISPALSASSPPQYLGMEVCKRYGWLWYDWDIKLINPNDFAVSVTYNQRMCFEGDAKSFKNLTEQLTVTISKNNSIIVRINSNGTAGWITAAINYSSIETKWVNNKPVPMIYFKKRISYASGLKIDPPSLTKHEISIYA